MVLSAQRRKATITSAARGEEDEDTDMEGSEDEIDEEN